MYSTTKMSVNETNADHLVKVYVRPRPFSKDEIELKKRNVIHCLDSKEIVLKSTNIEKKYNFDYVFSMSASQTDVYDIAVSPLIDYILSGYTCTIFAYGQTGTGKTHTMIGTRIEENDSDEGMIPRAAFHLFAKLKELKISYNVLISFTEIYNEEVRDLLDYDNSSPLKVYEDRDNKGATCIKGVTELEANSLSEVYDLLNIGISERHTASTKLNRNSSRSHTIFTIVVCTREDLDSEEIIRTGKLHLIDLAGSENIGRSGATEMRAREAGTINKSLLTLGKVIKALALKMPHIPYRESKLTRILQDSLGGKSKTCMIATFSPCSEAFEETISTLDYAHMARNVANCPTVNVNRNRTGVCKSSQEELMRLRQELYAARDGEGFYMNRDTYEQINVDIKYKSSRISNLLLEVENMETRTVEMQKRCDDLDSSFQRTSCNVQELETKIEKETSQVKERETAIETTTSKILHLDDVTTLLHSVCSTSTAHVNLFFEKYQQQCERTLHNAQVATSASDEIARSFNEMKSICNTFFDKQDEHSDEIEYELDDMYYHYNKKMELLEFLAKNFSKTANNFHLSIDTFQDNPDYKRNMFKWFFVNKVVKEEFFKCLNMFWEKQDQRIEKMDRAIDIEEGRLFAKFIKSDPIFEKNLNSLEETSKEEKLLLSTCAKNLDEMILAEERKLRLLQKANEAHQILLEVCLEKREELTKEKLLLQNAEQQFNSYLNLLREKALFPIKEIIKVIGTFNPIEELFQRLSNEAQKLLQQTLDDKKCLQEAESSFKKQALDIIEDFKMVLIRGLYCKITNLQIALSEWAKELKKMGAFLKTKTQQGNAEVDLHILHSLNLQSTFTNDVILFIQRTIHNVNVFEENIVETVHVGDTPVKQSYQFPRNIKNELWEEVE